MEFRRRKAKGRSRETYKEWVSDCGFFRITWTNEWGYKHYHACVRVEGDRWDFAYRRGPHKTFKKAVESCEKNKRLWDAFIKLSHSPGRRDGKLLELKVRAPSVFFNLPVWVREQAEPSLLRMLLCPSSPSDREDDSETSKSSDAPSSPQSSAAPPKSESKDGPAQPAAAKAKSARKKTATLSKDTSSPLGTPATDVVEPVEPPEKSSSGSTKRKSSGGKKTAKSGKSKTGSDAADSVSSPAKRKKR